MGSDVLVVHSLLNIPDGAALRSVVAEPAVVGPTRALRVHISPEIEAHGVPGVDFVDRATFVELPVEFRTGTLRVRILSTLRPTAPSEARGFAGLAFGIAEDASRFQAVYVRPANGLRENPPAPRDGRAIQYFAFPEWPFDRLRELRPESGVEASADIGLGSWIDLEVEVTENRIHARVDGRHMIDTPTLRPPETGTVGLFVDIGTEAFFRDLKVTR